MSGPSEFLKEAARLRDKAVRARRMAGQLSVEHDRLRLDQYARGLEEEAADWERRVTTAKPAAKE